MFVEDFIKGGVDVVLIIGCSGGVTILDQLLRMYRDISHINPHENCIALPHQHLAITATSAMRALDAIASQC